jgi:hypothetical protein
MKSLVPTIGIVAVTVAIVFAIIPMNGASARITQETFDTSCTNGGGNEPNGQQPSCQNTGGLDQQTETTCKHNPSGSDSCPPGQNK